MSISQLNILTVKVPSIRGLSPEFARTHKKGELFIFAEIGSVRKETGHKRIKSDFSLEFGSVCTLQWEFDAQELQLFKSQQPKVKLQLAYLAEKEETETPCGFALVDLRDFSSNVKPAWLRLHGLTGAEMNVSARASVKRAENIPHNALERLRRSEESGISYLNVDSDGDGVEESNLRENLSSKYAISVTIEDCAHLEQLPVDPESQLWLSWSILEVPFQSSTFVPSSKPKRTRDTIHIKVKRDSLRRTLEGMFPIRCYLCTEGRVLAAGEIRFEMASSGEGDQIVWRGGGWNVLAPLGTNGEILSAEAGNQAGAPAISASMEVTKESIMRPHALARDLDATATSNQTEEALRSLKAPPLVAANPPSAASAIPTDTATTVTSTGASGAARTGEEASQANSDGYDHDEFEDKISAAEDTRPDHGTSVAPSHPPSNLNDEKRENSMDVVDETLHHYRLSIDVHSIEGLVRPAHFLVSYSYGAFCAGKALRTRPVWVPAHSTVRLDNGSTTFESCLSSRQFETILATHPLVISAFSKTQLGSALLGQVNIDLSQVKTVNSYRCPLSGKIFASREEYNEYRKEVIARLRLLNSIERSPPSDPVIVYAEDSLYRILPPTSDTLISSTGLQEFMATTAGSKLRVVIIIEDLGAVGPEIAIPVQKGHKMHGGALYDAADPDQLNEPPPPTTSFSLNENPLQRTELTATERSHLLGLTADWEQWQKTVEAQWREKLREREMQMKKTLEEENVVVLGLRADDLKRAQAETGRLEIRLRESIAAVELQKAQLMHKEEEMNMKLAQKTAELMLLQKRVRDEAKIKVETESRRSESLESQISTFKQQLEQAETRSREVELDFEKYRRLMRGTPETLLREEAARLKASLEECRAQIEKEKRSTAEALLEKEHFRAQMNRLAVALKRERERSSAIARQDLEQLRLEFLAREERYVLDGDLNQLRRFRDDISALKAAAAVQRHHSMEI